MTWDVRYICQDGSEEVKGGAGLLFPTSSVVRKTGTPQVGPVSELETHVKNRIPFGKPFSPPS